MNGALLPFVLAVTLAIAGCMEFLPPQDRFPSHDATRTQEDPDYQGLVVRGTLTGGGPQVAIHAVAVNEGPNTFKVSAICVPPWSDDLRSSGGEVQRVQPMAYCAAFGLKDFRPGESIPFDVTWNATLWDHSAERYVDAPSGYYSWTASFETYRGGEETHEFDDHDRIRLEFQVTVQ